MQAQLQQLGSAAASPHKQQQLPLSTHEGKPQALMSFGSMMPDKDQPAHAADQPAAAGGDATAAHGKAELTPAAVAPAVPAPAAAPPPTGPATPAESGRSRCAAPVATQQQTAEHAAALEQQAAQQAAQQQLQEQLQSQLQELQQQAAELARARRHAATLEGENERLMELSNALRSERDRLLMQLQAMQAGSTSSTGNGMGSAFPPSMGAGYPGSGIGPGLLHLQGLHAGGGGSGIAAGPWPQVHGALMPVALPAPVAFSPPQQAATPVKTPAFVPPLQQQQLTYAEAILNHLAPHQQQQQQHQQYQQQQQPWMPAACSGQPHPQQQQQWPVAGQVHGQNTGPPQQPPVAQQPVQHPAMQQPGSSTFQGSDGNPWMPQQPHLQHQHQQHQHQAQDPQQHQQYQQRPRNQPSEQLQQQQQLASSSQGQPSELMVHAMQPQRPSSSSTRERLPRSSSANLGPGAPQTTATAQWQAEPAEGELGEGSGQRAARRSSDGDRMRQQQQGQQGQQGQVPPSAASERETASQRARLQAMQRKRLQQVAMRPKVRNYNLREDEQAPQQSEVLSQ